VPPNPSTNLPGLGMRFLHIDLALPRSLLRVLERGTATGKSMAGNSDVVTCCIVLYASVPVCVFAKRCRFYFWGLSVPVRAKDTGKLSHPIPSQLPQVR
jgi:hypothetical protein